MSQSPISQILGRIPSGVFILTTRHADQETGMLASWVMQAGFAPPMLTAAVHRDRYVGEWLAAGERFVLNVVGEGRKHLLSHFARGFEPGVDAFEGLEIERSGAGVPVLKDTVGYLECDVRGHVDSGDHRVFLAEIVEGSYAEDARPMVHIRHNGMRY